MSEHALLHGIALLQRARVPFCVVTMIEARGSTPSAVGSKALFTEQGLYLGTVGGGRLELACAQQAAELLASGQPMLQTERWNLQTQLGMTCGGEVTMLFEAYRPAAQWQVVVFGAGHVAQKLCRILAELDCGLTCIDTRPEWLAKLPDSERVVKLEVPDYRDGVASIATGAMVVLMTMGHESDMGILRTLAAVERPPAFLGVIGSATKARLMRKQLRESGVADTFIDAIACPIGEAIGNSTPPEIAISVVAQLLRVRDTPAQVAG